jgi:hypothetical protein
LAPENQIIEGYSPKFNFTFVANLLWYYDITRCSIVIPRLAINRGFTIKELKYTHSGSFAFCSGCHPAAT